MSVLKIRWIHSNYTRLQHESLGRKRTEVDDCMIIHHISNYPNIFSKYWRNRHHKSSILVVDQLKQKRILSEFSTLKLRIEFRSVKLCMTLFHCFYILMDFLQINLTFVYNCRITSICYYQMERQGNLNYSKTNLFS